MAIDLRQREAHRQPGIPLAARQRIDPRADLLGDARRGKQAQTDHRRQELLGQRMHLLECIAHLAGEQFRQHEIPDEQLHQQRDVAEDFDVGRGDQREPSVGDGTQHADDRADEQRDDPRAQGQGHGPLETFQQPGEVGSLAGRTGLDEYFPVPVVSHAPPRFKKAARNSPLAAR